MKKVICVVEGDGDVAALPLLLRRMALQAGRAETEIPRPIPVKRGKFLSEHGEDYRQRMLGLARLKAASDGVVLVLLDADNDCPAQLAQQWTSEVERLFAPRPGAFVIAKREFESWFIAAVESIAGKRQISANLEQVDDPEGIRDPKAWLRSKMPAGRTYSETVDQPALAALFDWQAARIRSPSLDKLCREFERLVGASKN